MQQPNLGLGCLIVEVSRSHTIRHTHTRALVQTPRNEWSAHRKGRYVRNTCQIEEVSIHSLSGMQTYAIDHTAAGIGIFEHILTSISEGSTRAL